MISTTNSTRVQAPDNSTSSAITSAPRTVDAGMTTFTESPSREGDSPMRGSNRRHPRAPDMRRQLRVATWNVITLSHDGYAEALSHELQRYKISLAGLTEVRLTGSGSHELNGASIFFSGGDRHERGVGLYLDSTLKNALLSWQPVSDRLLVARLKHRHGAMSVVVVYAPTEEANPADKDTFYCQLDSVVSRIPRHDHKLVLGDFNAVTGTSRFGYENVLGSFGSGVPNDNSERFISFCSSNGLSVMGSWFRRRDIHRMTWISNDRITKKEIDHVLVSDRSIVHSCRVFRGAEAPANTDHRLVIASLAIQVKYAVRSSRKKPDVSLLTTDSSIASSYVSELRNLSTNASYEEWHQVKDIIIKSAHNVLPPISRRRNRPWLSDESLEVLDRKKAARLAGDMAEARRQRNIFKAKAKRDLQVWYNEIAESAEEAAGRGRLREVYQAIRTMQGKSIAQKVVSITKPDGSSCSCSGEELECWCQHFAPSLNQHSAIPCEDLDNLAVSGITDIDISVNPPSFEEVKEQVIKLQNRKAPGSDEIYPEFLKGAVDEISSILTVLFRQVWSTGDIPNDWKEAIVVPVYKGKGARTSCNNYRPISLLSVPGKVFAAILLSRIKPLLLRTGRPNQSGFRPGRSTSDAILALRLLAEVHREFNRPLFVAFLDIKSAFDSVDREALWKWLAGIGTPDIILCLIRELYSGTSARIRVGSESSDSFATTSGVRQGCVIASWLFNGPIDWVMNRTCSRGGIQFGSGGSNGDSWSFTDLDYADDAVVFAPTASELPNILHRFQYQASTVGLQPSWSKTKIMNIGTGSAPPPIVVDDNHVDAVDSFIYLGSLIDTSGYSSPDIKRRIGLASSVFKQLDRVWRQGRLSHQLKLKVYKACVQSVLLYGSETWTMLKRDISRIRAFDLRCQRKILGIRWFDRITNQEVSNRTGLADIALVIKVRQHTLFGHVRRMDENAPAHQALKLAVQLRSGRRPDPSWRRSRGRPRLTWLQQLFDGGNLTPNAAWDAATDRTLWRALRPTAGYAS